MVFTRLDLLYILLPVTLAIFLLKWRRKKNYFTHPLLFYLQQKIKPAPGIVHFPKLLEYPALGCLLVALLNPVLPSGEYLVKREGLDILLILDLSTSMQEPIDPRLARYRYWRRTGERGKSRLEAVKEEIVGFVQKRGNDRLALVVFSENGYVVAPLTQDTRYLTHYLTMVDHETLASEGQTAIGEGILVALHLADQQPRPLGGKQGRLMVVLTDGENNTGRDVFMAIEKAAEAGFKIHFIGVDIEKAPNAARLIASVKATGGNYYDVRDREQLEQAYADINRIEKGTFLTKERGAFIPRYYPFALAAFLLLALSLGLRTIPYFTEIS